MDLAEHLCCADYLRDNLTGSKASLVLRGFNFCIIDEVDSILIDEARTPLIISGPAGTLCSPSVTSMAMFTWLLGSPCLLKRYLMHRCRCAQWESCGLPSREAALMPVACTQLTRHELGSSKRSHQPASCDEPADWTGSLHSKASACCSSPAAAVVVLRDKALIICLCQ